MDDFSRARAIIEKRTGRKIGRVHTLVQNETFSGVATKNPNPAHPIGSKAFQQTEKEKQRAKESAHLRQIARDADLDDDKLFRQHYNSAKNSGNAKDCVILSISVAL